MQWKNSPNAGFSPKGVTTWLPVNPNYAEGVNVADQEDDPSSLLHFYRRALKVRRDHPALIHGDYQPLLEKSETVLAFTRIVPDQRCLVLINMGSNAEAIDLNLPVNALNLIFSTHDRPVGAVDPQSFVLEPFEALILETH